MSLESELQVAVRAARQAGARLKQAFGDEQRVLHRDARDVKIAADVDAEREVLNVLNETNIAVLAEESGQHGRFHRDGTFWVVDPLDGTGNYHRGIPGCCVSIALWDAREPVLGVVYDFVLDEIFAGIVGTGATMNGERVRVSGVSDPATGILATGFPKRFEDSPMAREAMFNRMRRFMKVRMIGTSALAIAYVACGRFDAYDEDRSMIWDFAAGVALVRAAGGQARFDPAPDMPWAYRVRCVAHEELWTAIDA